MSTKTHGFVTIKKTDSRCKGIKDNQGCALAEPGGPWHPTFALWQLENLRLFIQIICWHPRSYWSRVLGSIQFSLEHSIEKILKENWFFFFVSWFWSGSCFWLSVQTHDTCSGNPVVPCTGTPARIQSTNYSCSELLGNKPLMTGKSEINQFQLIVDLLGTPSDQLWPGFSKLPGAKSMNFKRQPYNNLKHKFSWLSPAGLTLINHLLMYDPCKRASAADCLENSYFVEKPLPVEPDMMPTFPEHRNRNYSKRPSDYQAGEKRPVAQETEHSFSRGFADFGPQLPHTKKRKY